MTVALLACLVGMLLARLRRIRARRDINRNE